MSVNRINFIISNGEIIIPIDLMIYVLVSWIRLLFILIPSIILNKEFRESIIEESAMQPIVKNAKIGFNALHEELSIYSAQCFWRGRSNRLIFLHLEV